LTSLSSYAILLVSKVREDLKTTETLSKVLSRKIKILYILGSFLGWVRVAAIARRERGRSPIRREMIGKGLNGEWPSLINKDERDPVLDKDGKLTIKYLIKGRREPLIN